MNKSFVVIILLALGLTAGLYSLPVVVENNKKEAKLGAATRDVKRDKMPETTAETEVNSSPNAHSSNKLTAAQTAELASLKSKYSAATSNDKLKTGKLLYHKFEQFQQYDSAAYYAEQIAKIAPSEESWLETANLYYQAFTFAIDNTKAQNMGAKARDYYQKIIDKNPAQLMAKTNMAMTYVGTNTPMQGILMLREVVGQNPDFEPALFNLGILSMRSNQFAKALDRFKQILKNNPENSQAAFYMGLSLVRLGRNDEARQQLLSLKSKNNIDPAIKAEIENILNELK